MNTVVRRGFDGFTAFLSAVWLTQGNVTALENMSGHYHIMAFLPIAV